MIDQLELTASCSIVEFPLANEILKVRSWQSSTPGTRGVALLVHGLGAHSAWFEAAARQLAARGFLVYAYDQRGFGSRRDLNLNSYKEWIDDLALVVAYIDQLHPGKALYLMGNSMGALVVMAASSLVKVDGIVIFSPGFDGHPETFTLAYKVKSIISALFSPKTNVELPYNTEVVSRDRGVRDWIDKDKDKRLSVPGAMLFQLLQLSNKVVAGLKRVQVPVLMITAGKERVVNNPLNEKLFARLEAPAKKHVRMHEAFHDLMFDPLVDEVADEIVGWQEELHSRSQA